MKKKITTIIIGLTAVALLTLNSCKSKSDDPTPAPANGTIAFHLHTMMDTSEVANYDSVYVTHMGIKISVHFAQLYISDIQLIKLDGSTVDVPGAIVLKKQQIEPYILGSVPAGNYKSVKFDVGLNPTTNASTPNAADSTLNQPQMWFDAAVQPSGFVFVNFQGKIDTTAHGTGTVAQMLPFSYKIGTNANLKTVIMPDKNYTVSPNQTQYIHMMIDYNMLFMGIHTYVNSNLTMNTAAANGTSFGAQLAYNIPDMFMYE